MNILWQLADWQRALGGAMIGAILGSFIGALCSRWPAGQSVLTGRSQCSACAKIVPPHELVPVLSFLALGGRCSRCDSHIARSQLAAEIGAMTIGAAAFLELPPDDAARYCVMGWMLLPIAILDYKHLWLPARLTFVLALLGICSALLPGSGDDWRVQIAMALICWAALEMLRLFYLRARGVEGMGKGDPKLLAALALWTPPAALPLLLLLASAAGLAFALLIGSREKDGNPKIPFGAFLAGSALIVNWPGAYL
jgi:leader peptidase (prepilin peptidase) / N-methyltransferase